MATTRFDHLSRRSSLAALALGGFAGLTIRPAELVAKQSAAKKAKKKCKKQEAVCAAGFQSFCEGEDSATCLAKVAECCAFTASCDMTGFVQCLSTIDN